MTANPTLSELQVDQYVSVYNVLGDMWISAIDRVTLDHIFVDEVKYRRSNGKRVGSGMDWIRPATDADHQFVLRKKLVTRLTSIKPNELLALDIPQLTRIVELIDEGNISGRPKKRIFNVLGD